MLFIKRVQILLVFLTIFAFNSKSQQTWYPYQNDQGKWTFLSEEGERLSPLLFDSVSEFLNQSHAAISINGLWGVIDSIGEITIPVEFSSLQFQSIHTPDFFSAKVIDFNSRKLGLLSLKGEVIIPLRYISIESSLSDPKPLTYLHPQPGFHNVFNCYFGNSDGDFEVYSKQGTLLLDSNQVYRSMNFGVFYIIGDAGVLYESAHQETVTFDYNATLGVTIVHTNDGDFLLDENLRTAVPLAKFKFEKDVSHEASQYPFLSVQNEMDKWGAINGSGDTLVPFEFNNPLKYNQHFNVIVSNSDSNQCVYSLNGERINNDNYYFHSLLFIAGDKRFYRFRKDSLFGVISENGQLIIAPKWKSFEVISTYKNTFVIARSGSDQVIYCSDGSEIFSMKNSHIGSLGCGYFTINHVKSIHTKSKSQENIRFERVSIYDAINRRFVCKRLKTSWDIEKTEKNKIIPNAVLHSDCAAIVFQYYQFGKGYQFFDNKGEQLSNIRWRNSDIVEPIIKSGEGIVGFVHSDIGKNQDGADFMRVELKNNYWLPNSYSSVSINHERNLLNCYVSSLDSSFVYSFDGQLLLKSIGEQYIQNIGASNDKFIYKSQEGYCIYSSQGKRTNDFTFDKFSLLTTDICTLIKDGEHYLLDLKSNEIQGSYKSIQLTPNNRIILAKNNEGNYDQYDLKGKLVFEDSFDFQFMNSYYTFHDDHFIYWVTNSGVLYSKTEK